MPKEIQTFSKINILLKICGKKENGYHIIETVFLPLAEPHDTLSFELISDFEQITISSNSTNIPLNRKNICVKTAELYAVKAKIKPSWHFHIEKNIPIAAGLGGGSGNAAGVLNLLNNHYKKLSEIQLLELAAKIGADVPFFLNPSFSAANGIGEKLYPINKQIPDIPLLLLNLQFPVSANWAYNNFQLHKNHYITSTEDTVNLFCSADFLKLNQIFCNDLEPAILKKFPILQLLKSLLIECNASFSAVSGSGPTIFALFQNHTTMNTTAEKILEYFGNTITIIKAKPLL